MARPTENISPAHTLWASGQRTSKLQQASRRQWPHPFLNTLPRCTAARCPNTIPGCCGCRNQPHHLAPNACGHAATKKRQGLLSCRVWVVKNSDRLHDHSRGNQTSARAHSRPSTTTAVPLWSTVMALGDSEDALIANTVNNTSGLSSLPLQSQYQ